MHKPCFLNVGDSDIQASIDRQIMNECCFELLKHQYGITQEQLEAMTDKERVELYVKKTKELMNAKQ